MATEHDLDVVVGAGPAGLATAHMLRERGRRVRVLEAADHVGGRMTTLREDGFVVDAGAEMIATHGYPVTWRLLAEAGMTKADVPRVRSAISVWRDGRVHANVGRPLGLLTGAGLSRRARRDVLRFNAAMGRRARSFDPDRPESTPLGTRTVAEVAAGYERELTDYMFDPLVGAFFGWRADRSAAAPLVSLLLATKSTRNWRTYRDGMDALARRLADGLDVTTGCRVERVEQAGAGVRLETSNGVVRARSVVLAVPAPVALALHPDMPADERPFVAAATYTPMLRVSAALREPLTFASHPQAYVVIVPAAQNPVLSVVTIDHRKCATRAPAGRGLISLLTHPSATAELLRAGDDEVVARVTAEAEQLLPGVRAAIDRTWVHRFANGLPEATPQALERRAAFMRRPPRAIEYAGDWVLLRPNSEGAMRSAELAAERVLGRPPSAPPRAAPPDGDGAARTAGDGAAAR